MIKLIGLSLTFATAIVQVALPQETPPLEAMQLQIQADEATLALVMIQRFEAGEKITATTNLVHLSETAWAEAFRSGAEGIQVDIVAPASVAMDALFKNTNGEVGHLSRKQILGIHQRISMRIGKTLPTPEVKNFELTQQERLLLEQTISLLNQQNLATLASDDSAASLDANCLAAFNSEITAGLGNATGNIQSARWFAWSLVGDERSVIGELSFERGQLEIEVTFRGGKIQHFTWKSAEIPPGWFTPTDVNGRYAKRAERLAELLLTDQAAMAKRQFALSLQDGIAVQALAKLATALRETYGDQPFQSRLLDSQPLDTPDYPILQVKLLHEFNNGKRAISQSTFIFRGASAHVPKAELSNIYFSPAWTTQAPEKFKQAVALLSRLFPGGEIAKGANDHQRASNALTSIAEAYRSSFDLKQASNELTRFLENENHLDVKLDQVDFDQWAFLVEDGYARVVGKVKTSESSSEIMEVVLDFDGDAIAGLSLKTALNHFSTLTHLPSDPALERAAETFWRSLLSEDRNTAYNLLSEQLRERFPRVELDLVALSSGMTQPVSITHVQTRQSTQIDRSAAITASVFSIAVFKDGSQQSLRCDFDLTSAKPSIIEFTSDFTDSFRVDASRDLDGTGNLATRLLPLLTGNAEDIIEQTQVSRRRFIDRDILQLFLDAAQPLLPATAAERKLLFDSGSLTHEYQRGIRREVGFVLHSGRGFAEDGQDTEEGNDQVRVQVTTQFGELISFHIDSKEVDGFLPPERLGELALSRSNRFMGAWLGGDAVDRNEVRGLTIADLQDDETMIGFEALRAKLLSRTGLTSDRPASAASLDGLECSEPIFRFGGREVEIVCKVRGPSATTAVKLLLQLDAISLRIAGLQLVR